VNAKVVIGVAVLIVAGTAIYFWSGDDQESTPTMASPAIVDPPRPTKAPGISSRPTAATEVSADQPDSAVSDADKRWLLDVADALEKRGDPESLAAAAMLLLRQPEQTRDAQARAADLVARASEQAAGDPSIQMIAAEVCKRAVKSGVECNGRLYEQRLIAADPGNGIAWMDVLEYATAQKDVITQMATLSRMAGTESFDVHFARTATLINSAIARAPVRVADGAAAHGPARNPTQIGLGSAITLASAYPWAPLTSTCTPQANSEIVASCRRIARVMMRGDTVSTRVIGGRIAAGFEPPDSAEAREINESLRRTMWIARKMPEQPDSQYATLLERTSSEVAAREEAMRLAGVPTTPPDDWQP
jgi:hypothetical protein